MCLNPIPHKIAQSLPSTRPTGPSTAPGATTSAGSSSRTRSRSTDSGSRPRPCSASRSSPDIGIGSGSDPGIRAGTRPIDACIVTGDRPARARAATGVPDSIIRIARVHAVIGNGPAIDSRARGPVRPIEIIVVRAVLAPDHPNRQHRRR